MRIQIDPAVVAANFARVADNPSLRAKERSFSPPKSRCWR